MKVVVFVVVKYFCYFDRKCVDILLKIFYIFVIVGDILLKIFYMFVIVGDRLVREMCL